MNTSYYFRRSISILLLIISMNQSFGQPCKEIVGYYPNWQWYDRNKLVNPLSINYSKYTILNYCFFVPNADGTISSHDPWADENLLLGQIDWASGGYVPNTSIVERAHAHGVKILPSIGGWTLSYNFPSIAADPLKRQQFANSCVNLIQTYNFDGIDLDWEYPGYAPHNGTVQDKANFNLLLSAVRTAIDNYGQTVGKDMLLTAAVGAAQEKMEHVDWPVAAEYLDIINVMSYDYFGTWDNITNHNAPLNAPAQGDPLFNLAASIDLLTNTYGVSPGKITAGLAFYGRTAKTSGTPGLHVTSTGLADNTTFAADEGTPLYYNVLQSMNQFDYHWDPLAKSPYLTGKNGLNTFVSFDNVESIELKAQHIVEMNLRGAIIWEITGDYTETSPGSGIIANTPLVNKLNAVFCNYSPSTNSNNEISIFNHEFLVYPNPGIDRVRIQSNKLASFELIIQDLMGRKITSFSIIESDFFEFDCSNLPSGPYLINIFNDSFSHKSSLIISH